MPDRQTPYAALGIPVATNRSWRRNTAGDPRQAGFRLAPAARREHPYGETIGAGRTPEELRALMNGDLATSVGRSDLVRLALRLIVEEALEGGRWRTGL